MIPTRNQVDAELKLRVVPEFRRLGFKGSYPHFYRDRAGHVDLATVQFSSSGEEFVIELSFADCARKNVYIFKETQVAKLRVSQTTKRLRLGTDNSQKDNWFHSAGEGEQLAALCVSINELLCTQGSTWWLQQDNNA
jgi:Domain of unknown function (DUF4304)